MRPKMVHISSYHLQYLLRLSVSCIFFPYKDTYALSNLSHLLDMQHDMEDGQILHAPNKRLNYFSIQWKFMIIQQTFDIFSIMANLKVGRVIP